MANAPLRNCQRCGSEVLHHHFYATAERTRGLAEDQNGSGTSLCAVCAGLINKDANVVDKLSVCADTNVVRTCKPVASSAAQPASEQALSPRVQCREVEHTLVGRSFLGFRALLATSRLATATMVNTMVINISADAEKGAGDESEDPGSDDGNSAAGEGNGGRNRTDNVNGTLVEDDRFAVKVGDELVLGEDAVLVNAVATKPCSPPQEMLQLPC
eukprot:6211738-Pleurochrysis_carterae.AAC.2